MALFVCRWPHTFWSSQYASHRSRRSLLTWCADNRTCLRWGWGLRWRLFTRRVALRGSFRLMYFCCLLLLLDRQFYFLPKSCSESLLKFSASRAETSVHCHVIHIVCQLSCQLCLLLSLLKFCLVWRIFIRMKAFDTGRADWGTLAHDRWSRRSPPIPMLHCECNQLLVKAVFCPWQHFLSCLLEHTLTFSFDLVLPG